MHWVLKQFILRVSSVSKSSSSKKFVALFLEILNFEHVNKSCNYSDFFLLGGKRKVFKKTSFWVNINKENWLFKSAKNDKKEENISFFSIFSIFSITFWNFWKWLSSKLFFICYIIYTKKWKLLLHNLLLQVVKLESHPCFVLSRLNIGLLPGTTITQVGPSTQQKEGVMTGPFKVFFKSF